MTVDAAPRSSLVAESLLFAGRLMINWRRAPAVWIQALLFPAFLLVTYKLLVGKSVVRLTGTDSVYGLVPMCAVAGAMFGSLAAGMTIRSERENGLLSQFWALPVKRASALTGRVIAEALRTLVSAILITAVGVAMGLRFQSGWLAVIPFVVMPVLVVIVFSTAVIAIAARSENSTMLIWLGVPAITLVFSSAGVPPVEMLPAWVRPFIELQPMAPTIAFMRGLALGGPVLVPLLLSLTWIVVLGAIIGPVAVRSYRYAAESGH